RLKLLKRPREILGAGMFADEIKYFQIALGIADHGREIAQFQQANVAVMILQRFDLELGAILRRELKFLIAAGMSGDVLAEFGLKIFEQRSVAERTFAIGPAFGVHLEDAEINPKLDFFHAIVAREFAHGNFSGLI